MIVRLTSRLARTLVRCFRTVSAAAGGNVAMIFALALPPIAVAAVGGIQLSYVVNVRSVSQDVADSAALAGAQQMSVSPVGAADRAVSWAKAQLATRAPSSSFQVSANAVDNHTLRVSIDAYTPSFFGDMLPKGGFKSHAEATGQQQALAPLCVLVDGSASDQLKVTGTSKLSGSCLVHGNGDVQADAGAAITATRVEAGGAANGPITPTALTGAPTVTDPFAGLNLTFPTPCAPTSTPTVMLPIMMPGVYQGPYNVPNNLPQTLLPGEYYFCNSSFSVGNNATLTGSDVVLIFDKAVNIDTKPTSSISLSGRQNGPLAGFVVIRARNDTGSFKIPTDPFSKITGAIYVPNAELELNGTKTAANASDWTVVAAKKLKLTGAANIQINTNYAGSPVSVPIGVGNKASSGSPVRIVR